MKQNTKKRIIVVILSSILMIFSYSCDGKTTQEITQTTTNTNIVTNSEITTTNESGVWEDGQVIYSAEDISHFGSGTPSGLANYDSRNDTAVIWNIDASLDNYGGVQTPVLELDFSKAVYFQMEVVSSFTQYIVKLAVEGESEYYYVLSDDNNTGIISVNVVDAMLSEKYQTKNTQPDPGYREGWIYDGEIKRCSFQILAKGPDGEQQTAELVIKNIAIYNNQPAVDSVQIISSSIVDNTIEALKGSSSVKLSSIVNPDNEVDQDIIWSTTDSLVATVDNEGNIEFVGVGEANIIACSFIDQSKYSVVHINVLSGYENTNLLKNKLETLHYDGSNSDISIYHDLFNTTWSDSMIQSIQIDDYKAVDVRYSTNLIVIENYFNSNNLSYVNEANSIETNNKASISVSLEGNGTATIYQEIDGKLYKSTNTNVLNLEYAYNDNGWYQVNTYFAKVIVVWQDGTVKKLNFTVLASDLLADFSATDLNNSNLWTIPDRSNQAEDPIINALSPAILMIENENISIKQNKYPESKYCFGGIVSNMFSVDSLNQITIILDVDSMNQKNNYVKTMWDIRIIYYSDDGNTVINSNPLKIETGYSTGINVINFTPTYRNFRIYLVVNGSDIGAQFSDATMIINHFKIYQENS